jgi:hypothetical protein
VLNQAPLLLPAAETNRLGESGSYFQAVEPLAVCPEVEVTV